MAPTLKLCLTAVPEWLKKIFIIIKIIIFISLKFVIWKVSCKIIITTSFTIEIIISLLVRILKILLFIKNCFLSFT